MAVDVLGGYRLVRRLGDGARADVYLGHPIASVAGAQQVAIKVYRAEVSDISIAHELDALMASQGPHVVEVVDLSVTEDRRTVVILQRLGPRTLSDLLAWRGELGIGEATTILVPLARAIARMHDAGVAHGRLAADAVLFTPEGAPVLACFGRAVLTDAVSRAARDESAEFAADLEDFIALAAAVLDAAGGAAVSEWLRTNHLGDRWADDFAARLFALGPAAPVGFASAERDPPEHVRHPRAPRRRRDHRNTATVTSRARAMTESILVRGRQLSATVRPRFWAIGAAAILALVTGLILVPETSTDATSSPAPTSSATPFVADSVEASAVMDDDPIVALDVLLALREECIRTVSILCLDAVNQPGSAALSRDQATIRRIQEGTDQPSPLEQGEFRLDPPWEFELEEQLGGAALVSVQSADSEPASILMVRSEAGWRIRDYLE